ncbi:hypothetical protein LAZ67_11001499 [Cordylochernes scorpioides]|uniref:CCHC-type domain-containing protein n=1 Tax=Cordylochernes scorpioides TaxID=51811 RepID=A0ABY6L1W8_9ARAC|nr:hypothetical protein LAZ67_11001499 [Cordylochernes scorpioides]
MASATGEEYVQEVKATRAHIADARAQQVSSTQEKCVYIEHCPDFTPLHYLQAVDKVVGGAENIIQLTRMNGHVLVGLATKALAARLVDRGLEIEGTTLRTFSFRKRAERLVIGNLPFFVEDVATIDALRPYGRVTSIAPMQFKAGEYAYKDGRREDYILLHNGVKLEKLPTRLDIKTKGDTLPAFLTFGTECSKCNRQGHRKANCPMLARQSISPKQAASPIEASSPAVPQQPNQPAPPSPAPAPPTPPEEVPGTAPVANSRAPRSVAPQPTVPAPPTPPGEVPSPAVAATCTPKATLSPQASLEPIEPMEVAPTEEETTGSTPAGRGKIRAPLNIILEQAPNSLFAETGNLGHHREKVCGALVSTPTLKTLIPKISAVQRTAMLELVHAILKRRTDSNRSVHPDHNTGQLRCLVRMDVLFWIDVCHIEGCKDDRVYMVRSRSCPEVSQAELDYTERNALLKWTLIKYVSLQRISLQVGVNQAGICVVSYASQKGNKWLQGSFLRWMLKARPLYS